MVLLKVIATHQLDTDSNKTIVKMSIFKSELISDKYDYSFA